MCYCVFIGTVAWFFGKYFALAFVGSEETLIINNVQFQLRVLGATYATIGVLFVLRNSLQGLGYSFMAMSAGVCELVARVGVAIWLVPPFGFAGACFAGPISWLLADLFLIPAYFIVVKRLKRKLFGKRETRVL